MFKRQVERSGVPVLVDAWAPWCGPCRMMAPAFAEAARVLEPDVRLIKLDTESEQALAARLSIRSIPTLILFRDGREIDRISGALQARQIVDWTRQRLGVAA
ncbi:Thioredoxin [Lutibaculum baratangense AMV1]|uniref:Thioredoxin n=2 Tax=Lutibaculum TaxID=1358438 RepID=V4RB65_9HYPH|nr:Thioredoxin [Lutibaculum baratangense AMV1]